MAYSSQENGQLPESSLLMPFSVRHFPADDKLCHHLSLQVFQDIYPQETVEQVLTDCHAWEQRAKALNMLTIVSVGMALVLFPRLPIDGVLPRLAAGVRWRWAHPRQAVATAGAICQRRQQLGSTPRRRLFRRCCRPLAPPQTPGAFYRQRRLVAIEGTCEAVADEPHTAHDFGRINDGPTQSPFPQLRALSLVEGATPAIFAAIAAPCRMAQARLAPVLLPSITAEMLGLLDRGLFAGPLLERRRQSGAQVLAGLEAPVLTHPCQRLSAGSSLAYLTARSSQGLPHALLLRVLPSQIWAPDLPSHGAVRRLVTTWLAPKQASAQDLIALYQDRWEIERSIDEHKTHLPLAHHPWRSRRPATVVQECYGLVLMHYGLRCWLPDAASHADLDPDRLSFSVAVELVQPAVYEFRLVTLEQHAALMQRLVAALGSSLVPPPRLRFSARVVKRPLSCFRRKRYWHRDGSPLKGLSFHEILRI